MTKGIEITKGGKVIARSENLRGILTRLRKVEMHCVIYKENAYDTATVLFVFADNSRCQTNFSDVAVLKQWLLNRRSLKGCPVYVTFNDGIFFKLQGKLREDLKKASDFKAYFDLPATNTVITAILPQEKEGE